MIEFLTALLVVITGVYAWLTYRLAKASEHSVALMREQLDRAERPYVEVAPLTTPGSQVFHLRVRNVGKTAAINLRLSLDRDFFQFGQQSGENLAEVVAFTQPIAMFPPGAELKFNLAQGPVVLGPNVDPSLTPSVFKVTASYTFGSRTVTEEFMIDLRPYANSWVGQEPLEGEVKRIREGVQSIAKSAKQIAERGT